MDGMGKVKFGSFMGGGGRGVSQRLAGNTSGNNSLHSSQAEVRSIPFGSINKGITMMVSCQRGRGYGKHTKKYSNLRVLP